MKTELDARLVERWADAEYGAAAVAAAREELAVRRAADDGDAVAQSHVGRALQRLSEACRLHGLLDEALQLKDATLLIWERQGKKRAAFLVRLQRALVLAELDAHRASTEMATLRDELDDDLLRPYYTDFWLEYEARRLAISGQRGQAIARLEDALAFRREHRAARIITWTERALRVLTDAA